MQGTDPPVSTPWPITTRSPDPLTGILLGPGSVARIPVPGDPGPVPAYAGDWGQGKK